MRKEQGIQEFLDEIGKSGSVLGLSSIRRLMGELGNVQDKLNIVHVAGTNGKGSLCAMVSSILREAGYRVGAYTSPAVFCREEQYQVNGEPITEEEFAAAVAAVKEACGRIQAKGQGLPTLFEVETAVAFLHFYWKKCDIALLETGLGGEGDATNIIRKPLVSVLVSISMDHMKFLGDSLAGIARAKAGIIKEHGAVAAIWPEQEEVRQVLEEACREKHASLSYAKKEEAVGIHWEEGALCFSYGEYGELKLSMAGAYQAQNSICAIKTAELLRGQGFQISLGDIRRGLRKAQWEGRFSVLCRKPLFLMDGAHNEDAAKKLRETLKMGFTNGKIIYIIGVLADKEYGKILELTLPLAWKVFTVTPGNPRALDGEALAEQARKYHKDVTPCKTVRQAAAQAMDCALEEGGMVLAFGSLSYLGELKRACGALCAEKYTREPNE